MQSNIVKVSLLVIILFLFFPIGAIAEKTVTLDDSINSLELGEHIQLLEDKENQWTIEQIITEEIDSQFSLFKGGVPNFGYTDSVYWVKMHLTNQSSEDEWLLEIDNPTLDVVTLYSSSDLTGRNTGDLVPFEQRELEHRNFVYDLDVLPGDEKTIYLRIETEGAMQIPLTIYSERSFLEKSQVEYGVLGLFVGLALVMALYNLFLFFSLKHKSYLYYVIFILFNIFTHLAFTGLAYQYIWPDAPWWNNRSIVFFMGLTNIVAILFAKTFLDAKKYIPKLNIFLSYLVAFFVAVICLLLVSYTAALNIIVLGVGATSIIIIIGAYICLKNGFRPARYFLIAWQIFFIGVVVSIMADAGMIPLNFITKYAWQLSTTFELILLSFALADKINMMRLEKEEAKKVAIKSQREMLESLERNDKLKDEFLAVTSHELRTPLNGIIGIAESLQDGAAGKINDTIRNNVSMIAMSGKRLAHLINDILDFSKLENDDLQLQVKKVYLKDVADVVVTICETLIIKKDIQIVNYIGAKTPAVLADENRLHQILYNLLGNSIKFTEAGEVAIHARQTGETVTIEVSDTGIGIPPEHQEAIFYPFNRGSHSISENYRGTGIGLNITKRLIELQQGNISLQSNPGDGTTFSFTLPLYRKNAVLEAENTASASLGFEESPFEATIGGVSRGSNREKGKRILVADDEPVNIQILINYLSLEGFQIETVSDGEAVIQLFRQGSEFDLVILDIMMPKISGFEVCRLLRKEFSLTELPIIMLTAKNQLDDRITAFEVGANDYLTKPVDKRELLSRTKTLIHLREAMHEVKSHAEELDIVNQKLTEMNDLLEEKVSLRTKELEQKNKQLDIVNAELIRVEKSRIELLSNISHELGTPLTFLQGYIQTVQEGYIDINDPKYLHLAQEKIKLLDRLISDLYDLAKFESGKMRLKIKQVDFSTWFYSIFEKFELDVKQNEITLQKPRITTASSSINGMLLIDEERMDQVLANLIYNAIKHTPKGGEISLYAEILPRCEKENDREFSTQVKIEVKDTGEGIAEEEIPYIFQRFYKGERQLGVTKEGSGLGLAITKEIIEYHKGDVWAESKNGKGTSIFLALPIILDSDLQIE